MSFSRSIVGVAVSALLLASPSVAQERAVTFFARGGGYNGLTSLDEGGSADLKRAGFNLGGGLGVKVHPVVTLRGDFNFARNQLSTNSVAAGIDLNRFFYDAAVQLQVPTAGSFTPYLFAGGGAVTLDPPGSGRSRTRPAATFGLGFHYQLPHSAFGFFAEGKSWLYRLENLSGPLAGFDRTQYELAWTGGLSYRLPF